MMMVDISVNMLLETYIYSHLNKNKVCLFILQHPLARILCRKTCVSRQLEKFLKERSAEIKDDRVKMLKSGERQVKCFMLLSGQETGLPL